MIRRVGRFLKFSIKFLIICVVSCTVVSVVFLYPRIEEISSKRIILNKTQRISSTFKIIEAIKNEIFTVQPPTNVFGNKSAVGEFGKAVYLPSNYSDEIKKLIDDGWKNHQFNQYISDIISINRSLSDDRTDYCKSMHGNYSENLPKTSVIITFHNEAWSTLLRTVHSIINRSRQDLLAEIILVDDFSTMGKS